MLSQEKNERLTAVGPGTPMGNLLRRYWWPVATHDMAGRVPARRRLLGEDLVLFRDGSGQLGLLAEQCPHRRASLALGCTEQTGLRCGYHGWLFGPDGRCLEQPGELADSTFASRIRAVSYPVAELGGLIFAYLGPAPAPLLPRYDLFVWPDVWRDIAHAELPCNFVQIMENSVDPYHVEWLHGRYGSFLRELAGEPAVQVVTKKHVKVAFEVFEHGILKRRVLEGQTEQDEDWKIGHPLVFPGMLRVGGGGIATFQIRVPVDDTHTWHVWYQAYRFDVARPAAGRDPGLPGAAARRAGRVAAGLRGRPGHLRLGDPGRRRRPQPGAPGPFGPRGHHAAQAVLRADGAGRGREGSDLHLPGPGTQRLHRAADGAG